MAKTYVAATLDWPKGIGDQMQIRGGGEEIWLQPIRNIFYIYVSPRVLFVLSSDS